MDTFTQRVIDTARGLSDCELLSRASAFSHGIRGQRGSPSARAHAAQMLQAHIVVLRARGLALWGVPTTFTPHDKGPA